MEIKIRVKRYLSEKKDEILNTCTQVINDCDKIHIKAPVGSGKTTMIIDLIKLFPNKRFIVLFPQISITEQVKTKLEAQNIEALEINSKTLPNVGSKNNGQQMTLKTKVFLTTIDSAYKLIEVIDFSKDDTVVIIDETHTFLTSARENHIKSVETILNGGFPIIGLSATPSTWVNRLLFGIKSFIDVETTKTKHPIVSYTEVKQGALRTLGNVIGQEKKSLVVVFTENKVTQYKLKDCIIEYDPTIIVRCLNADTKTSDEKDTWEFLMKTDKLPLKTNVFILNSVVQSGINILNKKIDNVYLIGEFDPFGFAQYLGRCRNYKNQFKYYHSPYSKQIGLFGGADEIQQRIETIIRCVEDAEPEFLDQLKILIPIMNDTLYLNKSLNLVPNKCMIATGIFEKLRGLSGETLINAVRQLFKDIEFEEAQSIKGEVVTSAKSKAKSRVTGKSDLVEFIKNEYILIIKLFQEMGYDYSEANLVKTINTKYGGKLVAKVPMLKQRFDKMNEMMVLMKEAQMTPHRLSTVAYLYYNYGKSDKALEEYVYMKNGTALGISEAIKFYGTFKKSNTTIKKALKELQDYIGDTYSAKEWKGIVYKLLPELNKSSQFKDGFYKFCLKTKPSNSQLKLVEINTSLKDYIEGLKLEHITVVNNRITSK